MGQITATEMLTIYIHLNQNDKHKYCAWFLKKKMVKLNISIYQRPEIHHRSKKQEMSCAGPAKCYFCDACLGFL